MSSTSEREIAAVAKLTPKAWPLSVTVKSPEKFNLLRTVPESKELPVTEETLRAFCLALSSVSVAFAVYAVLVTSSWPLVTSVRDKLAPLVAMRFSSLPEVRRVAHATLASVSAAEMLEIKAWVSAFVYPSAVIVITPEFSDSCNMESPALSILRTEVPSSTGIPPPVALLRVACLAARSGVSADVSV